MRINLKQFSTYYIRVSFSQVEYFTSSPLSRVISAFPEDGLVTPPYGGFVLENLEASGGWISSASDLVQFLDALNGSLSDASNGYKLLSVSAS